jgi:hypothetical protein
VARRQENIPSVNFTDLYVAWCTGLSLLKDTQISERIDKLVKTVILPIQKLELIFEMQQIFRRWKKSSGGQFKDH